MRALHRWTIARALPVCVALALVAACGKKDDQTAESAGTIGTTTGATASLQVADVTVGRSIGADKRVTNETTEFGARDTVFASVHTTGMATGATVTARFTFQDGQTVEERSETISPTGDTYTEFHIAKPSGWPAGRYTVHVLVNGQEAATKEYTVKK